MDFSLDNLKALVHNPSESLDIELKRWIDPDTPEGISKIAKACLALYNNNGGCLIVGIQDDGQPDPDVLPNVRDAFHGDVVEGIVSKYAFHPIEVKVEFIERDNVEYPVICVPSGVETPVAAKKQLGDDRKPLVEKGEVYVRSLRSNNTVSSAPCQPGDWERIAKTCFDNREADIGAFMRRHLSTVNLDELLAAVVQKATPTSGDQAERLLERGKARFEELREKHSSLFSEAGTREVAAVIEGEVVGHSANQGFLNRLMATMHNHSGWPPWVDCSGCQDESLRPYVLENGWEAFLPTQVLGTSLDFWRIEPTGQFYHLRAFEDDMPHPDIQKPTSGTELDFTLQVSRVAEAISNVLSFSNAMDADEKTRSVVFAFRWSGLQGRHLTSWADPRRRYYSHDASRQEEIRTTVAVPLETPASGMSPYVDQAVAPLFALFGGEKFEGRVIEDIVARTLQNRF